MCTALKRLQYHQYSASYLESNNIFRVIYRYFLSVSLSQNANILLLATRQHVK